MIILDTETTGLNTGVTLDVPVSLAIVDRRGVALLNTLIRPLMPVSPEALAVHGLTPDALRDAPTFEDIEPELTRLLTDTDAVVAWNAGYDLRVLMNAYHLTGRLMPVRPWSCAMERYGQAFGATEDNGRVKWWKLTAAFEVQYGALDILKHAHGALADAEMTAALYDLCTTEPETMQTATTPVGICYTHVQRKVTAKGDAYAEFTSVGGVKLNIFARQFADVSALFPAVSVADWLRHLEAKPADYVHPLRDPLCIDTDLSGKYPEFTRKERK